MGSTRYCLHTTIQCSLAEVITVILQMRLYALYHGSKILLVFMVTFFVAEVGIVLWILISTSLFNNGPSLAPIEISIVSGFDLSQKRLPSTSTLRDTITTT